MTRCRQFSMPFSVTCLVSLSAMAPVQSRRFIDSAKPFGCYPRLQLLGRHLSAPMLRSVGLDKPTIYGQVRPSFDQVLYHY